LNLPESCTTNAPYHIGLKAKERLANQEQWMGGQVPIIVATISFGMGVDKADVRYGVLLIE